MANANTIGVRARGDHHGHIAPAYPMSPADIAAHRSASYVRPRPIDSDPHADELLHRVRNPRGNWSICPECSGNLTPGHVWPPKSALYRLEVEAAYMERDGRHAAQVAREIASGVAA